MGALLFALLTTARDALRRRTDLEAELLALRHQLLVLQRHPACAALALKDEELT